MGRPLPSADDSAGEGCVLAECVCMFKLSFMQCKNGLCASYIL